MDRAAGPQTMLAMLLQRQRSKAAHRKPSMLRARVWLRSLELDRDLAAGVDPAHSDELELRTLQLCTAATRQTLARMARRLVDESEGPRPPVPLALRLRPSALAVGRDALLELADTLEDPQANAVAGVARASWLLTDGTGPLYTTPAFMLVGEIEMAIDALWGQS